MSNHKKKIQNFLPEAHPFKSLTELKHRACFKRNFDLSLGMEGCTLQYVDMHNFVM